MTDVTDDRSDCQSGTELCEKLYQMWSASWHYVEVLSFESIELPQLISRSLPVLNIINKLMAVNIDLCDARRLLTQHQSRAAARRLTTVKWLFVAN
jgi:hypothetical protein